MSHAMLATARQGRPHAGSRARPAIEVPAAGRSHELPRVPRTANGQGRRKHFKQGTSQSAHLGARSRTLCAAGAYPEYAIYGRSAGYAGAWANHPALNYPGLIFAIGGRSLTWGGWSPELLDLELATWPVSTRAALRANYFADASWQIGVKETNDFIYGPLHTALRRQLYDGLNAPGNGTGFTFADLLDHPAVRYPDPGEPPISAALLRDWLNLPAGDATPLAQLRDLFKLEAPSRSSPQPCLASFRPTNSALCLA